MGANNHAHSANCRVSRRKITEIRMVGKAGKHRLNWRDPNMDQVKNDFALLGTAAKDYLESIVTDDKFETDSHLTAFNLGYEALARLILGWTLPPRPETKVIKNVED
jgi:hypothetical protein